MIQVPAGTTVEIDAGDIGALTRRFTYNSTDSTNIQPIGITLVEDQVVLTWRGDSTDLPAPVGRVLLDSPAGNNIPRLRLTAALPVLQDTATFSPACNQIRQSGSASLDLGLTESFPGCTTLGTNGVSSILSTSLNVLDGASQVGSLSYPAYAQYPSETVPIESGVACAVADTACGTRYQEGELHREILSYDAAGSVNMDGSRDTTKPLSTGAIAGSPNTSVGSSINIDLQSSINSRVGSGVATPLPPANFEIHPELSYLLLAPLGSGVVRLASGLPDPSAACNLPLSSPGGVTASFATFVNNTFAIDIQEAVVAAITKGCPLDVDGDGNDVPPVDANYFTRLSSIQVEYAIQFIDFPLTATNARRDRYVVSDATIEFAGDFTGAGFCSLLPRSNAVYEIRRTATPTPTGNLHATADAARPLNAAYAFRASSSSGGFTNTSIINGCSQDLGVLVSFPNAHNAHFVNPTLSVVEVAASSGRFAPLSARLARSPFATTPPVATLDRIEFETRSFYNTLVPATDLGGRATDCPIEFNDSSGANPLASFNVRWDTDADVAATPLVVEGCTTRLTGIHHTSLDYLDLMESDQTQLTQLFIPLTHTPAPATLASNSIHSAIFSNTPSILPVGSEPGMVPSEIGDRRLQSTLDVFLDVNNWDDDTGATPSGPSGRLELDYPSENSDAPPSGRFRASAQVRTGFSNVRFPDVQLTTPTNSASVNNASPFTWTVNVTNQPPTDSAAPTDNLWIAQLLPAGLSAVTDVSAANHTDCNTGMAGTQRAQVVDVTIARTDAGGNPVTDAGGNPINDVYQAIVCTRAAVGNLGGNAFLRNNTTAVRFAAQANGNSCDFTNPPLASLARARAYWGCGGRLVPSEAEADFNFVLPTAGEVRIEHFAAPHNSDNNTARSSISADATVAELPEILRSGPSVCRVCQNSNIRINLTNSGSQPLTNITLNETLAGTSNATLAANLAPITGTTVPVRDIPTEASPLLYVVTPTAVSFLDPELFASTVRLTAYLGNGESASIDMTGAPGTGDGNTTVSSSPTGQQELAWDLSRVKINDNRTGSDWLRISSVPLAGFSTISLAPESDPTATPAIVTAPTEVVRIVVAYTALSYNPGIVTASSLFPPAAARTRPVLAASATWRRFCDANDTDPMNVSRSSTPVVEAINRFSSTQAVNNLLDPRPRVLSRGAVEGLTGGLDASAVARNSGSSSLSAGNGDLIFHRVIVRNTATAPSVALENALLTVQNRSLGSGRTPTATSSHFQLLFVCNSNASASELGAFLRLSPTFIPQPGTPLGAACTTVTTNTDDKVHISNVVAGSQAWVHDIDEPYSPTEHLDVLTPPMNETAVVYIGRIRPPPGISACENIRLSPRITWGCEIDGGLGDSTGGTVATHGGGAPASGDRDLYIDTTPERNDLNATFFIVPDHDLRAPGQRLSDVRADTADASLIGKRAWAQLEFSNSLGASIRNIMFALQLGNLPTSAGSGAYEYDDTRAARVLLRTAPGSGGAANLYTNLTELSASDISTVDNAYATMPRFVQLLSDYSTAAARNNPVFALVTDPTAPLARVGSYDVFGGANAELNVLRDGADILSAADESGADYRIIVEVPIVFTHPNRNDLVGLADVRQEGYAAGVSTGDPSGEAVDDLITQGFTAALEFRDTCGSPIRSFNGGVAQTLMPVRERIRLPLTSSERATAPVQPNSLQPDLDVNIIPLNPDGDAQGDITLNRGLNIFLAPSAAQALRVQVTNRGMNPFHPPVRGAVAQVDSDDFFMTITVGNGLSVNAGFDARCVTTMPAGFIAPATAAPAPTAATSTIYYCALAADLPRHERNSDIINFDFTVVRNTATGAGDDLTFRADVEGRIRRSLPRLDLPARPADLVVPEDIVYSRDSILARIVGLDFNHTLDTTNGACTHADTLTTDTRRDMLVGSDCQTISRVEFFGLSTPGVKAIEDSILEVTVPNGISIGSVLASAQTVTTTATTPVMTPLNSFTSDSLTGGSTAVPRVSRWQWDLSTPAPRTGLIYEMTHRHRLLNTFDTAGTSRVYHNQHNENFDLSADVGFSITFNDGTPADDGFKVTGDQWINHPDIDEQPIAYRVVEP
ncbi:MAG: hypothetical protein K8963_05665, partial [Proteobacteria bacterium]|nr:hypothetical protein [Pseudomonadota bacterium]